MKAEIKVEKKDVSQEIKEEKKATQELRKQIRGLERTLKEMKQDLLHNEGKLKKMKKMSVDNERMKSNTGEYFRLGWFIYEGRDDLFDRYFRWSYSIKTFIPFFYLL